MRIGPWPLTQHIPQLYIEFLKLLFFTKKTYRKPPHRIGHHRIIISHTHLHIKLIVVLDPQLLIDLNRQINRVLVVVRGFGRWEGAKAIGREDVFEALDFLLVDLNELAVNVEEFQ